jgi:hypothetical protein
MTTLGWEVNTKSTKDRKLVPTCSKEATVRNALGTWPSRDSEAAVKIWRRRCTSSFKPISTPFSFGLKHTLRGNPQESPASCFKNEKLIKLGGFV